MWVFKEVNIIAVKVNSKLAFYLNVPAKKKKVCWAPAPGMALCWIPRESQTVWRRGPAASTTAAVADSRRSKMLSCTCSVTSSGLFQPWKVAGRPNSPKSSKEWVIGLQLESGCQSHLFFVHTLWGVINIPNYWLFTTCFLFFPG